MALIVTIDGIDKTKFVDWRSLKIDNILTSKVDKCSFTTKSYGNRTYQPEAGREVIITDNGTRIFGGYIVRRDEKSTSYKILQYVCQCVDYTRLLQKKLVAETYENMTIANIVISIIDTYCVGYGLTTTNVVCDKLITKIAFNYEPVQQVIEKLANLINFDWWVDYNKNIYFKAPATVSAPFGLTDTNGNFSFKSLRIRKDNSQIKNSIIVRGGNYFANTMTAVIECNGVDFTYNLPYKFKNFNATLTGQPLSIGIDFSSDADSYNALHNFDEKVIRFKRTDIPSAGATLSVSGQPEVPVLVKVGDTEAQAAMLSAEGVAGEYEYLITDRTLTTKQEARDRATAELVAYATTVEEGEFITETSGLIAGQSININSDAYGISENFVIRRVTSRPKTPSTLRYRISLISTRTIDMVDLLKNLLMSDKNKIDVKRFEVIDKVYSYYENITMADSVATTILHHPQDEVMDILERWFFYSCLTTADAGTTLTADGSNGLNVEFVAGPYGPTDTIESTLTGSPALALWHMNGTVGTDAKKEDAVLLNNWDLTEVAYTGNSKDFVAEEEAGFGISFKDDGTKMYIIGEDNRCYQYSLSTSWDVSTASYDSVNHLFSSQTVDCQGIFFKADGTALWICSKAFIYQYSLGTAWDITTVSYDSKSFETTSQGTKNSAIALSPDGTKAYKIDGYESSGTDIIWRYDLSTPWDITTASVNGGLATTTEDNQMHSFFWRSDGLKIFAAGEQNEKIYQYSCSPAWTFDSASYDSVSYDVSAEDIPRALYMKYNGDKFYTVGEDNDTVYEYAMGSDLALIENNTPTSGTGFVADADGAYSLNGSNEYLSNPNSNEGGALYGTEGTMEFWVSSDDWSSDMGIYQDTASAHELLNVYYDSSTLKLDQGSFNTAGEFMYNNKLRRYAQSFTMPDTFSRVTHIDLNCYAPVGGTTGTATVEINGDGVTQPDMSDVIGTATSDISTWGTSQIWRTFTFPTPVTLTKGATYWIQTYKGDVGGNNYWITTYEYPSTFAGDIYTTNNGGGLWWSLTSADMAFKIYSNPLVYASRTGTTSSTASVENIYFNKYNWHYVAITWKQGEKTRIYVDGVLRDKAADNLAGAYVDASTGLTIGKYSTDYWNGKLDEVMFTNYRKTTNDIKDYYKSNKRAFVCDGSRLVE